MSYIERPPGIEFLRAHNEDLFPEGIVDGSVLVTNIAFGAAALGAGHVEIKDEHDWWYVASELNWLTQGIPENHDATYPFREVVAFPELSPTSYRPEIFVSVFADQAYLDLDGDCKQLLGESPPEPLPHVGVVPPWCIYVLAFRLENSIDFRH